MDTNPDIMVRMDGPEVAALRVACLEHVVWGCFSIMEYNYDGYPYNTGLIIDAEGAIRLKYRKLHLRVPVEPWEPGDMGIPVCEGPNGSTLALIICHDGMFPEMARECAYRGADIMLRTAGYTAPLRHSWKITNQANAFCNLMYTASVCMAARTGHSTQWARGWWSILMGQPWLKAAVYRARSSRPRSGRPWPVKRGVCGGVENNIYQLGHRGYVAVVGGAGDCPYTFMQDLVAGTYRLPWEDEVAVTDGTSCGFPRPVRKYGVA